MQKAPTGELQQGPSCLDGQVIIANSHMMGFYKEITRIVVIIHHFACLT